MPDALRATQLRQLVFGGDGQSISIRLIFGQQVPTQDSQLASDGDAGNRDSFFAREAGELMPERSRMSTRMMCGLGQLPPHIAVSLFGDSSIHP